MKKIICILMALVLVMGFSACSNTKSDIPERYIEVIKGLKDNLKDPSSMMIYGWRERSH